MVRTAAFLMVILAVGFTSQFTPAFPQDAKGSSKEEKPAVTLKVGDRPPELKVSKWIQGDEVKKFEPGKIYVVEFWATWCGPCIAYMPHLADLQARFKNKGLTVIGFSVEDPKNNEAMVTEFVKKRGQELKYSFAYSSDPATFEKWMTAAGRSGIPCNFVVDKTGRIAYIGHPMYLELVLPKVIAGTLTAKEIGDEMAKVEAEIISITASLRRGEYTAGLHALNEFESKYPSLTDFLISIRVKLGFLPKYGEPGEAKKYADALITKAIEKKDTMVLSVASALLRLGDGKESQELMALAVKAAEAEVKIDGGKNAGTLLNLADTYFVSGDKAKAKEFAQKALDAATDESDSFKQYLKKEAKRLGAEN